MAKHGPETRRQILRAALKHFANAGYAATSVQQIVGDAGVSKPALYYYFGDKAGLFEALVNEALDERLRVMQEAAARGENFREQAREILTALFEHFQKNRELTRIAFATAYAAPGEVPPKLDYLQMCRRNIEFIHSLIKQAQKSGELDRRFDSHDLAYSFFGNTNFYIKAPLLMPGFRVNRATAERVVELFLAGAAAKKSK
ncbi:MAG TPA: TetR/AcrR family transcriptional regulator [Candidatus Acidoferrales bacterium]|jgi:AcrR family transcriptional regulator|nr:TetR/AcrR family transcriptional regulator [Candidatus Acidoferrales bacterium]